jgi:sugar lactone lactonase YvrE
MLTASLHLPPSPHWMPSKASPSAWLAQGLFVFRIGLWFAGAPEASANPVTNLLAWPPPPAEPRIVYVQSIRGPADLGIKRSVFIRAARWLAGGSGDSGQLVKPFGIALDDAGNLLLTDTGTSEVFCLEQSHRKWLRWQQAGKVRFESPVAVARHRDTIYVADSALGRVLAFTPKGKLLFEITRDLERPSGLALTNEKLFIADSQRHQIVIFDLRGAYISKFGQRGSGPGEFNFPTHVAADPRGDIFVTDSLNCRIQVFDASGRFQRVIGSPGDGPGHFGRPKGVGLDGFGHIYVVDAVFDNVQIYDPRGSLLLSWGEPGSDPGEFWLPNGVVVGRDNRIYVADSYNRRIQVFSYTGKQ